MIEIVQLDSCASCVLIEQVSVWLKVDSRKLYRIHKDGQMTLKVTRNDWRIVKYEKKSFFKEIVMSCYVLHYL